MFISKIESNSTKIIGPGAGLVILSKTIVWSEMKFAKTIVLIGGLTKFVLEICRKLSLLRLSEKLEKFEKSLISIDAELNLFRKVAEKAEKLYSRKEKKEPKFRRENS